MDDKSVIRIKNQVSEIAKVSHKFNDFSTQHQLPKKISHEFDLALDEILNNIITYGYRDQNEHEIKIEIHYTGTLLILIIEDDGRKFNPLDIPEPDTKSSIEERRVGGLGIHLIRKAMDDITYKYENKKNNLTMIKNIREQ